jgi:RNA recognition motif-containing protein
MIRNVPNRLSQWALCEELEAVGLTGTFDFLYVPLDLRTMSNVGYAFINFSEAADAQRCAERLQGMRLKKMGGSSKVIEVSRARVQGKDANMKHFLKSCSGNSRLRQRRPLLCKDGATDRCLVNA